MGFYSLDLDKIAEYKGTTVEELKQKSYAVLEQMQKDMEEDKILKRNNRNAADNEYERIVLKYFRPLPLLKRWFDEREIVLACAFTGVTESNICQEIFIEPGKKCHYSNGEYIRTSVESVKQYTRSGEELADRKRQTMDVYRVANQYQGLSHGPAILHLLYKRYPELSKFGFTAYEVGYGRTDYEIYPKTSIYVSLAALMSGDIDWILYRNREYCKFYNNGRYTSEECEKTFRTDEAQEMFKTIYDIGVLERQAGHLPVYENADGKWEHIGGLIHTNTTESGNIMLLEEPRDVATSRTTRKFKLSCAAPYALYTLIAEFSGIAQHPNFNVCVCHVEDFLSEHPVNVEFKHGMSLEDLAGLLRFKDINGNNVDISGFIVHDTFGTTGPGVTNLTLRINCPGLMLQK